MKRLSFMMLFAALWMACLPSGGASVTKVVFYSPHIVRIVKYPSAFESQPEKKSFTVIMQPEKVGVKTTVAGSLTTYATDKMRVVVHGNGTAMFLSADGDTLLREQSVPGFEMRRDDADEGKYVVNQRWSLADGEHIYGLGQRKDRTLNLRGKHIKLWNTNTYTTIPVFISSKGYGVFWDNMSRSFFDDDKTGTSFKSEVAEMVDYYFIFRDGTADGVISGLRSLTGRATMFPLWAMGHWQCRERYKTSDELAGVLDKYRALQIPLDGIVQDWQDRKSVV